MKNKLIINQSNFPKVQKQALFIVRPKPSQIRQPSSIVCRQGKSNTSPETTLKSIEDCIGCLDLYISQQQAIEQGICLKMKDHLLILKQKYSQQQSYNQNRKEIESSQVLLRKQSSKYFPKQKFDTLQDYRSKQNFATLDCFQQGVRHNKNLVRVNKQDHEVQMRILQSKVKNLNEKIEQYDVKLHCLQVKLKIMESDLQRQKSQKGQLKQYFTLQIKQKQVKIQILQQQLGVSNNKNEELDEKLKLTDFYLRQRQKQITNLWLLFSK